MQTKNLGALIVVLAGIVGTIVYLDNGRVTAPTAADTSPAVAAPDAAPGVASTTAGKTIASADLAKKAALFERAKEIADPSGFINTGVNPDGKSKPITIGEFTGKKVVLLDIWTYSCINCERTLPYLKSWYDKYKDKGLVIIGLHTPEFEFEKKYDNVLAAVKKFGITYPVVLDNDYSTWHAYKNQYWPRHYLIDIDGFIVADHIGEGGYEETEAKIQKALAEGMVRLNGQGTVAVPLTKETATPETGSPEIYFGAARNRYLGNGASGRAGAQSLSLPAAAEANTLYLGGRWTFAPEYAQNEEAGASIVYRYRAKEVYFVASSETGVKVKVYNDGALVRDGSAKVAHDCRLQGWCGGEDVSADGETFIREDRLYKLINNGSAGEHTLKIEIESPGLKAYTFTFG